jgi:hypothetical protein
VPLREERARRIIVAVLQNIDNWRERALEIEANCSPGNKARALSLARDLELARLSLCRLAEMDDCE